MVDADRPVAALTIAKSSWIESQLFATTGLPNVHLNHAIQPKTIVLVVDMFFGSRGITPKMGKIMKQFAVKVLDSDIHLIDTAYISEPVVAVTTSRCSDGRMLFGTFDERRFKKWIIKLTESKRPFTIID